VDYAKKFYSHLDRVNSTDFSFDFQAARFFVIKSYSEEDVHKSMKYQVWTSTQEGNKRLNEGYKLCQTEKCPLYLFFSVNGSGQFLGVCKMTSEVTLTEKFAHWMQEGKWTGKFKVEWIYIKDIPNREFKSILIPNNENKPVTNSRDAQEIPFQQGMKMLEIFKFYKPDACLLDEFEHYDNDELRRKEEIIPTTEHFGRFVRGGQGKRRHRSGRGRYRRNQQIEGETHESSTGQDK
jgi:hypothetical protein